jgi:hypothetical protein
MKLFGKKKEPGMENSFKPRVEPPREKRFGRRKASEQATPSESNPESDGNRSRGTKKERAPWMPIAAVGSVFDGTVLTNRMVIRNIPFILFIVLLAIIYISNSSSAERNRRDANKLDEELKELRYEYISTKSAVMYLSNPSQIGERLKERGLQDNLMPPVKIFIRESHGDQNRSRGRE